MAQEPVRTTEAMMAELVHHMAQLVIAQKESNELLRRLLAAQQPR